MRFRALVVDDLGVLRAGPGRPVAADGVAALVRSARERGLATAVLSNADVVDRQAGLDDLVDVVLVSGATGLRKPEREAFVACARRLGVTPDQCVFVDDAPGNVRAAAATGMAAVLHRSLEQTSQEVEVLLGLP
jgi:putative hydrolase of the HAD superfamily